MISQFFVTNIEVITKLALAVLLGVLIGLERLFVHKEAGMKTHAMVSLGAALFVIISEILATRYIGSGGYDASRIASQVIVGIGFLGAGSIIFQGNRLTGLTTASGFWVTAGIGMAAGFGFYSIAVVATLFVLVIFIPIFFLERPIMRMVNRNSEIDNNQR